MEQGDIYWVDIPPEHTVGSEQYARRPYVIVSKSSLNRHSRIVVGVPLTTNLHKASAHRIQIPSAQIVKDPGCSSLIENSVALTDQIRVLDKSRLQSKIGALSATARGAIEIGLSYLLDIR